MNSFQKEFITLIYAALSGEEQSISDSFDYSAGFNLAEKHSITALFCRGAELCHVAVPGQMIAKVSEDYCKAFIASEKQLRQLEVLFAAFEQNQIQYLPLKGTVLKPMYPSAELRSMGDADILIRLEQYPAIAEILTRLGYTFQKETGHELIWKKGVLLLELHKHIMTQENRDYYRYFGQGWERAVQRPESNRFDFSNEDFYIYVFAHLTKHYRISGIGIKHLLDIWVCRQSFSDLDMDYVEQELRKMKLEEFHSNVIRTLDMWFRGTEPDYRTELVSETVFSSGEYGTHEMSNINHILRDTAVSNSVAQSKFKRSWRIMFLPYRLMCQKYNWLKKLPFLLPVAWIIRLFDILFFKRKELKKYRGNLKKINQDTLNAHSLALAAVGIGFHFEETA